MLGSRRNLDMDVYLKPGRLANVIAAIQVMASAERPEGEIENWAYTLDRNREEKTINKWTGVFQEHPEFFLTYRLESDSKLKAALRWRYAFKTYDSATGKEYKPAEIDALPPETRKLLTTKPLTGDQVETLLNTAIGLHTRVLEAINSRRYWIPMFAAVLGFVGAVLGALLSAFLQVQK
jgi:hypothetical protein